MSGALIVLYVNAGGGHRAAAEGLVAQARAQGLRAEAWDALEFAPRWFADAYVRTHLVGATYTPSIYGGAFAASDRPDPLRERLRRGLDHWWGEKLIRALELAQPLAVVATHFYPLMELSRARRQGRLRCPVGVSVTDYVAHAVWAVPGLDLYTCPPGRAASDLRERGIAHDRILPCGIPVAPAFARPTPWQKPAEGRPLRVLVTGGGFGVGPMRDILRSFDGQQGLQVEVLGGRKARLVQSLRRLAARHALDAVVEGFVTDMPQRLARAHVVVGKPGGLTMTETLAACRPLVAVGAVPGQESHNLAVLRQWGAGVRSRPRKVGPLLNLLRRAGSLPRLARQAEVRAMPQCAFTIVRRLLQLAPQSSGGRAA